MKNLPQLSWRTGTRSRRRTPVGAGAAAAVGALVLAACASTPGTGAGAPAAAPSGGSTVRPTSVVVLEGRRDLDVVLSLGLPLRGYPVEEAGALDLPSPVASELEAARSAGAEELFLADEVNLEAVVAAAPDLVVSRAEDAEPFEDELGSIATLVTVGDQGSAPWQDDLRRVAATTGTSGRAAELTAAYERRVAEVADEYADVLATTTLAPVSISAEGSEVRPERLLSTVLRDVGALPSTSWEQATAEDGAEWGPEQLVAAHGDADGLVVLVNDPSFWAELQDDPLYRQLPAVAAGHVVRSDKQTHEGAALTALHAVDVVEQLLDTYR